MAQSRNINVIPNNAITRVHVSQGDVGRTIYFNLYEGSLAYTPTSGDIITCVGTKPSGLGFTVNCTWSGNVVTCVTTEEMTDESGSIDTELVITSSDESTVLGTSNFRLCVEANPHPDGTTDGNVDAIIPELTLLVNEVKEYAEEIESTYHAYGSPWVASTVSEMTDTDKIYVYTGSESGYTSGNWYYYNGTAWVSGGVYNSVAVNIDDTLTVQGACADAKAVGDAINALEADSSEVSDLKNMYASDFYNVGDIVKYPLPDSDFENIGVNVYTDKRSFFTDYKHENHKNTGGTTYYFSPNGNNSNDGLTEDTPKLNMRTSGLTFADGDTCILLDGYYKRTFFPTSINVSINIIAKNNGKAIKTNSDNSYTYTLVDGTTYSTSRSNVASVLIKIKDDVYTVLTNVTTLATCESTPLTWCQVSSTVYVNAGGLIVPDNENTFLNLSTGEPAINIVSDTEDINVYIEGITFIGGQLGGLVAKNSTSYNFTLHAYQCNFFGAFNSSTYNYDAVSILGGKAYFVECVCAYARKDGFNYHASNSIIPYGFELNCKGFSNGKLSGDNTNNGSTIHDGGKIIRIGCVYHDNYGANVADVHTDTKSLNLRCNAFDSQSSETAYSADFSAQQSDATMWLDCCKASGSDWSIYAYSGTTMYVHNSDINNTHGSGSIDETWNPYS